MTDKDQKADYYQKLKNEFENSYYRELYHEPGSSKSMVYDPKTHRVCLKKRLKYGDPRVFEYLKTHHNEHIPKIISWRESGDENETLVVIEEYITGKNLAEILSGDSDVSGTVRKGWILQLCDALEFLHSADPAIIHRDVKAENIMIAEDGTLKLVDYDAAKIYHPGESRDTVLLGTDGNAAPEQYGFRQSDERTDIYGTGGLIRELFSGEAAMLRVADKACMMDPADRYQTVSQLKKAVERTVISEDRAEMTGGRGKSEKPAGKHSYIIPGFRSRNPAKMAAASVCYILMVVISLLVQVDGVSGAAELWANRIACLLCEIVVVDAVFAYGPLFRRLPGTCSRKIPVRVLARTGWGFAGIFIILGILVSIFP